MQVKQNKKCDHIIVCPIDTEEAYCLKCKMRFRDSVYYSVPYFFPSINLNLTKDEYENLYYQALSYDMNADNKQIIMHMHSIYESNKINNKIERIRKYECGNKSR